jgi:hypothetical protein
MTSTNFECNDVAYSWTLSCAQLNYARGNHWVNTQARQKFETDNRPRNWRKPTLIESVSWR